MTDSRAPTRVATRTATGVVFFVFGVAVAAWAPLVPYAKARAGLDERGLGLVLLCFGTGSLIAMPLAGSLIARFGIRRVIVGAELIAVAMLPLLATVPEPLAIAAALLVFGAGLGATDVAMNLQAISVERAAGRAMMSGFHALYSVGGIVGASGVAAALTAGASPDRTIAVVATVLVVALLAVAAALSDDRHRTSGPRLFVPRGIVLTIGLLGFVAFLIEGAVLDWGAVFLTSVRGAATARAGAGYVAFSVTMTAGRLTGDRLVQRFGDHTVLACGAGGAAVGLLVVAGVPAWPVTIVGFALIGAGASNIVPILFSAAGRQTEMPESLAVPAMTTIGYAGLLAGPAMIGFAAREVGLPLTFVGLAVLAVVVGWAGSRLSVRSPGAGRPR